VEKNRSFGDGAATGWLCQGQGHGNGNALEQRQIMSDTEANYVAGLAMRWARTDPMEQWVNAAPEGHATNREWPVRPNTSGSV
jgi:hypothetical protein